MSVGKGVERAGENFPTEICREKSKIKNHAVCGMVFVDIKKNHAIVAWFGRGLPMSIEIKTPIVYNESMTRQSKIKYTIGGY